MFRKEPDGFERLSKTWFHIEMIGYENSGVNENEADYLSKSKVSELTVRLWSDKAAFLQTHLEYWLAHEAENGAFLRLEPTSIAVDALCLSTEDASGNVVQTAVFTPQDQIILSRAPTEAVGVLCNYLASCHLDVPGIFAPAPTSRLAAKCLENLIGKQYQLVKELLHLELQQPPKRRAAVGIFQAAIHQDLEHLASHRAAIQAESNTQRPFDAVQSIHADLQNGFLYKWIDDRDRIVASASIYYDRRPTSAYINHVYVEPVYRRQGYASALVGKLCEQALEQGRVPRLSVDAVNQPAYQAYLKLGFVLAARMDNIRAK